MLIDSGRSYEFLKAIDEGAYGNVYACVQNPLGRIVAVKQCKHAQDATVRRMLLREIRILRSLPHHPCVVTLLDAFRSQGSGRPYLVFEHMERSLHKVVHRDIKPANVLLSGTGAATVAKLCDFGFAREVSSSRPEAQERLSSYVVTRWYRAPEILVGDRYGMAADVWSLGCTLAEMAAGGVPLFPGASTLDQLARIMRCFGPLPASQTLCLHADKRLVALRKPPPRSRNLAERLKQQLSKQQHATANATATATAIPAPGDGPEPSSDTSRATLLLAEAATPQAVALAPPPAAVAATATSASHIANAMGSSPGGGAAAGVASRWGMPDFATGGGAVGAGGAAGGNLSYAGRAGNSPCGSLGNLSLLIGSGSPPPASVLSRSGTVVVGGTGAVPAVASDAPLVNSNCGGTGSRPPSAVFATAAGAMQQSAAPQATAAVVQQASVLRGVQQAQEQQKRSVSHFMTISTSSLDYGLMLQPNGTAAAVAAATTAAATEAAGCNGHAASLLTSGGDFATITEAMADADEGPAGTASRATTAVVGGGGRAITAAGGDAGPLAMTAGFIHLISTSGYHLPDVMSTASQKQLQSIAADSNHQQHQQSRVEQHEVAAATVGDNRAVFGAAGMPDGNSTGSAIFAPTVDCSRGEPAAAATTAAAATETARAAAGVPRHTALSFAGLQRPKSLADVFGATVADARLPAAAAAAPSRLQRASLPAAAVVTSRGGAGVLSNGGGGGPPLLLPAPAPRPAGMPQHALSRFASSQLMAAAAATIAHGACVSAAIAASSGAAAGGATAAVAAFGDGGSYEDGTTPTSMSVSLALAVPKRGPELAASAAASPLSLLAGGDVGMSTAGSADVHPERLPQPLLQLHDHSGVGSRGLGRGSNVNHQAKDSKASQRGAGRLGKWLARLVACAASHPHGAATIQQRDCPMRCDHLVMVAAHGLELASASNLPMQRSYDFVSVIDEGAYGTVFACVQQPAGTVVAIKQCKHATDPLRSLHKELDARGGNPEPQCAIKTKLVAWQLFQGLAHLHSQKVVHRDIKPANVLLSGTGAATVAKLCDFGFAREVSSSRPEAQERLSSYVVTRWYRAPEILVGDRYGMAADVWSLGCTLAEMAAGGVPLFPGASTLDQLARIMRCFGPLAPNQTLCLLTEKRLAPLRKPPPRSRNLAERLKPEASPHQAQQPRVQQSQHQEQSGAAQAQAQQHQRAASKRAHEESSSAAAAAAGPDSGRAAPDASSGVAYRKRASDFLPQTTSQIETHSMQTKAANRWASTISEPPPRGGYPYDRTSSIGVDGLSAPTGGDARSTLLSGPMGSDLVIPAAAATASGSTGGGGIDVMSSSVLKSLRATGRSRGLPVMAVAPHEVAAAADEAATAATAATAAGSGSCAAAIGGGVNLSAAGAGTGGGNTAAATVAARASSLGNTASGGVSGSGGMGPGAMASGVGGSAMFGGLSLVATNINNDLHLHAEAGDGSNRILRNLDFSGVVATGANNGSGSPTAAAARVSQLLDLAAAGRAGVGVAVSAAEAYSSGSGQQRGLQALQAGSSRPGLAGVPVAPGSILPGMELGQLSRLSRSATDAAGLLSGPATATAPGDVVIGAGAALGNGSSTAARSVSLLIGVGAGAGPASGTQTLSRFATEQQLQSQQLPSGCASTGYVRLISVAGEQGNGCVTEAGGGGNARIGQYGDHVLDFVNDYPVTIPVAVVGLAFFGLVPVPSPAAEPH
eukprot:XP_001694779.1 predicted protein [Chlamydomonas reinhardtii]